MVKDHSLKFIVWDIFGAYVNLKLFVTWELENKSVLLRGQP